MLLTTSNEQGKHLKHCVMCSVFNTITIEYGHEMPQSNNQRTSDGGNGNHSVSLPIILIKIQVNQMLPSFIYKLAVGLCFMILHLIPNSMTYFGAKMVTFCIVHKGNRKYF